MNRIVVSAAFGLLYLAVGIATHSGYGSNWDESIHFNRGQAFLRFYLTGTRDYKDLPPLDKANYRPGFGHEFTDPSTGNIVRRSIFQHTPFDSYNADMQLRNGHPAFSDIMASVFNLLLFQKTGWVDDVHAYNYYMVVTAAILVGFVYYWTSSVFGAAAGVGASISLFLYPLFMAESHYNIKDVPQATFYAIFLLTFFTAVFKRSPRLVVWSGMWAGFAFSTKFNILFAPFILIPWFFCYFLVTRAGKKRGPAAEIISFVSTNRRFMLAVLSIPVIAIVIWIASFPRFWFEPRLFPLSFDYYQHMGLSGSSSWKLYPILYVVFKTPAVTLFFATAAIICWVNSLLKRKKNTIVIFNTRKRRLAFILLVFWLTVPVARVILPSTSIYGGSRQIMEYVPALAILSGIGFSLVYAWVVNAGKNIIPVKSAALAFTVFGALLTSFIPLIGRLTRIYPNEGAYYNELIGGLKGAREAPIPDAGNTLGNPYIQGVKWINEHAEKNAKVALGYELMANIPYIWFRNDIQFSNSYKSGPAREGEYIIMVYDELLYEKWYPVRYVRNELTPLYTVSLDGVPLLSVWKNEPKYLKKALRDRKEITSYKLHKIENALIIDFSEPVNLMRIDIDSRGECPPPNTEVGEFLLYTTRTKVPYTRAAIMSEFYEKLSRTDSTARNYFLFSAEDVHQMKFSYGQQHASCFSSVDTISVWGSVR